MSQQTNKSELAFRFLLGQLSEEERSAFENRFFEDDEVFEELEIAEEELIELYLADRLGVTERLSFEQRVAASPQLRERVVFGKMLANKADAPTAGFKVTPQLAPSWWERLFGSAIFQRPAYQMAFVAALLIIVLGGIAWMVRQSRLESQRLEAQRILEEQQKAAREREAAERARLQPPQQPSPAPVPTETPSRTNDSVHIALLTLQPGGSRSGGGSGNQIKIEPGTDRLRLTLIVEDTSYRNYMVHFRGLQTGKSFGKPAQLRKSSNRLVVEIPAEILHTDDYMIHVEGISSQGTPEPVSDYSLSVRRK